jgi:hypothetical protein
MVEAFPVWPRRRSTAVALAALVSLQVILFFAATERSFFTHEDYYHFALARDRSFLKYLITPIIHTYPAPGLRLLFFLLDAVAPLNYLAARALLLTMLGATTIFLGHLVRTLARSDRWWTVALLTPFALSVTLVSPVNLWSNGVPVIPALFFTVVALSAWIKAYTTPHPTFWVWVTVTAVAAAGAFYLKFLLIPAYLLVLRLAILPRLVNLPSTVRSLWHERMRWFALVTPSIVFVSVYVLSGLAARSYIPGDRPYLEYLVTAWFRALGPASVLNIPFDGPSRSATSWLVVVLSQLLFWAMVAATWKRSSLALRGWALFVVAFATNMLMVGSVRLPGEGVAIAYWLRYYPEVVLFLPIALALGLRQGAERRPEVAWERTVAGQTALGLLACVQVVSLAIWAPRMVSRSDGARAKVWFDNLQGDLQAVMDDQARAPRIIDSETPEYVVLSWMAPYNRVSTILGLLRIDVIYNDLVEPTHFVLADGRLAEPVFRPTWQVLPNTKRGEQDGPLGTCIHDGGLLQNSPGPVITGERLALRALYSAKSHRPVALTIDTGDPDRPYRDLELRPFRSSAELVDLGTSRLVSLRVEPSKGDMICFERMEIGSLGQ